MFASAFVELRLLTWHMALKYLVLTSFNHSILSSNQRVFHINFIFMTLLVTIYESMIDTRHF